MSILSKIFKIQIHRFPTNFIIIRTCFSSLKLKKIACPLNFTKEDLEDVIWKGLEFEKLFSSNSYYYRTKLLEKKTLIYLSSNLKMNITVPIIRATRLLKMDLKIIQEVEWMHKNCLEDVGLYLSHFGDIVAYEASLHERMKEMREACRIPLLCIEDCRYSMVDSLSDLMTFYQTFGYLHGLKLAWLGPPSRELNTLLHFAPNFDLKVAFCCACDPQKLVSPTSLHEVKNIYNRDDVFQECTTFEESIKSSDIIVTKYIDRTDVKLNAESFKYAHGNWVYLRKLPRKKKLNDEDVFTDPKRCITWKSALNNVWICMSLIIKLLVDYNNVTSKPNFVKQN